MTAYKDSRLDIIRNAEVRRLMGGQLDELRSHQRQYTLQLTELQEKVQKTEHGATVRFDEQSRELAGLRGTVRKREREICDLRSQVATLEQQHSELRQMQKDLNSYADTLSSLQARLESCPPSRMAQVVESMSTSPELTRILSDRRHRGEAGDPEPFTGAPLKGYMTDHFDWLESEEEAASSDEGNEETHSNERNDDTPCTPAKQTDQLAFRPSPVRNVAGSADSPEVVVNTALEEFMKRSPSLAKSQRPKPSNRGRQNALPTRRSTRTAKPRNKAGAESTT